MTIEFWEILMNSFDENWYIMVALVVSIIFLSLSITWAIIIRNLISKSSENNINAHYYALDIFYTIFIASISIYPLLGMLGTVSSLICIDMSSDDISGIQNNFFLALTSTAWGILFAVLFKTINAIFQPFIENQISKAKNTLHK